KPFRETLSPAPGAENNSAPPLARYVRGARLISQENQLSWRGQSCPKMRDSSTSLGTAKGKPAFIATSHVNSLQSEKFLADFSGLGIRLFALWATLRLSTFPRADNSIRQAQESAQECP